MATATIFTAAELTDCTVTELKDICKDLRDNEGRDMTGFSSMNKAQLIRLIVDGVRTDKKGNAYAPKVRVKAEPRKEVNAKARELGLSAPSKYSTTEIRRYVDSNGTHTLTVNPDSVAGLREQVKAAGIKGYSKCTKAMLQEALVTGVAPKREPNAWTADWCKALLSDARKSGKQIPAYSKLKADGLRDLVRKLGLAS